MAESSEQTFAENLSLKMKLVLAGIRKKFDRVAAASATDLELAMADYCTKRDQNVCVLLLDVREKEEYEVSHLPQAVWVDESMPMEQKVLQVSEIISSLPDSDKLKTLNVFAYCSIGYRSSALVNQFYQSKTKEGLPKNVKINFFDVKGGIFQWANETRPMVNKENEPTKYVHPYNFVWGKLINKKYRYQLQNRHTPR